MRSLLVLLACTTLHADIASEMKKLVVEADYADSDGDTVVLQGNVSVAHDLGRMRAGEARFRKLPTQPNPTHEIELHERVILDFVDGGSLTCRDAYLSTEEMGALFLGSEPLERVRYRDDQSAASPTREPVSLSCDRMEVQLHQRTSDKEEELPAREQVAILKDRLKSASASGHVRLLHGDTFDGECEAIHYLRQPAAEQLPEAIRDHYNPEAHKRSEMPCDMVELTQRVRMEQEGLGEMATDGAVWVTRKLERGKPTIDLVLCAGETSFLAAERQLVCHGTMIVDREARQATLQSPSIEGVTPEELQISYDDQLGGIHADRVTIHYNSESEGHPLSHVELSGNVRIRNGDEAAPIQYALADQVEYDPWSETLTLSCREGKRVLFLDEERDTKVSAAGVVIRRSERLIQGVGGVRFTLNENEVTKLRESFGI